MSPDPPLQHSSGLHTTTSPTPSKAAAGKRSHWPGAVIAAAWLVHAIAWFVPVHKYGVRLPEGIPGVEAFTLALTSPFDPSSSWDPWFAPVTGCASALTNFLMVASLPVVVRGSPRQQRVLAWAAVGATMVNAFWWIVGMDRGDLRAGYYLWWTSFMLLALGAFTLAHAGHITRGEATAVRRG